MKVLVAKQSIKCDDWFHIGRLPISCDARLGGRFFGRREELDDIYYFI